MKKIIATILCLVLCLSIASAAMASTVTFGTNGWEPIRWNILSYNERYTTLISEECIACRPFGRTNNWHNSSLRSWLNNDFAYYAFTAAERSKMCYVDGDLIRLPSVGDMTNPRNGFSANRDALDRSRSARASYSAINQGVWTNDYGYCSYYTMTPCDGTSMYQIRTDGRVGVARIDRDNVGVRIVITIKSSAL